MVVVQSESERRMHRVLYILRFLRAGLIHEPRPSNVKRNGIELYRWRDRGSAVLASWNRRFA